MRLGRFLRLVPEDVARTGGPWPPEAPTKPSGCGTLNVDDAIQRICATTSNTLTPAQWYQYIPQLPYDPPCAHSGRYGFLQPQFVTLA